MTAERSNRLEEVAKRLQSTSLREFRDPRADLNDKSRRYRRYRRPVSLEEVPLPELARYALKLIGLSSSGPGEKVAWWVHFLFQDLQCELALEKFGLRLYVEVVNDDEAQAHEATNRIVKRLRSSARIVENLALAPAAPGLFQAGMATVINQHMSLRRTYEYFRERASNPFVIEDERKYLGAENDPAGGMLFSSGKQQMQLNSFHDLVASVNAYLSLLEHLMVLALPFEGCDPSEYPLEKFIGLRWGDKYRRFFDLERRDDKHYYDRLVEVVERWRNTYSHGGFEKGNGSTVYLHYAGIGAIPVGLSSANERPGILFMPTIDEDIHHVYDLFDELDAWLSDKRMTFAMEWITSGLDVRFDPVFRVELNKAMASSKRFSKFLDHKSELHDRAVNMDWW